MESSTRLAAIFAIASAVSTPIAIAHDDATHGSRGAQPDVVTVAFGAGLNTAGAANHHVLPDVIRVGVGDVVNFVVAGFHVIRVYDRGVRLNDVKDVIPDECEVNPIPPATFPSNCFGPVPVIPPLGLAVYYEGLNPVTPPTTPPFATISTAQNRVEPVIFQKPGRYFVICAVLPHFNDKMYAWVEVLGR